MVADHSSYFVTMYNRTETTKSRKERSNKKKKRKENNKKKKFMIPTS